MAFYKTLRKEALYPRGTDAPGQAGWIADRLLRLRALMNGQITSRRRPNSLIIGSWNIRHFDGGRKRLDESYHYIAEIIDHFDICALQEVKDSEAVDRLMRLLGPNWTYFINDSSGPGRGNHERMAFLFNSNRVFFRNLIGELVLSKGVLPGDEQVGRTPFFAAFQAGWFKFTLCSAHIVFEETAGRPLRRDEIAAVAKILDQRAKETGEVHVFLGDMNIENDEDDGMAALRDNGFTAVPFGPTSLSGDKHYDQIAFTGADTQTKWLNQSVVKWQEAVFTDGEAAAYEAIAIAIREPPDQDEPYTNWARSYRDWRTHEMSDHLPVWIEMEVDYSNDYLLETRALAPGAEA